MKATVLILCIFVSSIIGCASADMTERINVIDLPSKSKQQIMEKSEQWLRYKFADGKALIDLKDNDKGRVIAKGLVYLDAMSFTKMFVVLIGTIDCVNGRTKLVIQPHNCRIEEPEYNNDTPCTDAHMTPKALKEIPVIINKYMEDYKDFMIGGKAPAWDGR